MILDFQPRFDVILRYNLMCLMTHVRHVTTVYSGQMGYMNQSHILSFERFNHSPAQINFSLHFPESVQPGRKPRPSLPVINQE